VLECWVSDCLAHNLVVLNFFAYFAFFGTKSNLERIQRLAGGEFIQIDTLLGQALLDQQAV
jgi:hypothetical protein